MSITAHYTLEEKKPEILVRAIHRRFDNVVATDSHVSATVRGTRWPLSVNLDTMAASYDSDYPQTRSMLNQAYGAELVIFAAEQEGSVYTEYRNSSDEFVIEVG